MRIEGWVLVSDLEVLGKFSNAIPVFLTNFLGENSDERLKKAILYIENNSSASTASTEKK